MDVLEGIIKAHGEGNLQLNGREGVRREKRSKNHLSKEVPAPTLPDSRGG